MQHMGDLEFVDGVEHVDSAELVDGSVRSSVCTIRRHCSL